MTELEYVEKRIETITRLLNRTKQKAPTFEELISSYETELATLNSIKKKLEAFEIIKNKGVDKKNLLESNNFREYNKNLLDTYRGTTYFKNEHNLKYTEKEYDLVSKVVKEITEDE